MLIEWIGIDITLISTFYQDNSASTIMDESLSQAIQKIEHLATASKLKRFLHHPLKYVFALFSRTLYYKLTKKGILINTKTAWNDPISVILPAGTDIYLTGGKSDDSEIRLAKFIANILQPGDAFIDVGGHFGYYTLLAKQCIGDQGRILTIEASPAIFKILQRNISKHKNIIAVNAIANSTNELTSFYEFPVLQSEYNTIYPKQFESAEWFQSSTYTKSELASVKLDDLLTQYQLAPKIIKIDTEGAEYDVLKGCEEFLKSGIDCYITIEYLSATRDNTKHKQAVQFLNELGYISYEIDANGNLQLCANADELLLKNNVESEQLVFRK